MSVPPKKTTTKPRAKAKPRELSKAEAFYVEAHYGQKDAADLARDLAAPKAVVQKYLDGLAAAGFAAPAAKPRPTPVQRAGFAVKDGTVSMTPASSETGDDFAGVRHDGSKPKRPARNEKFLRRRAPSIHVINPDLPVR